MTDLRETRKKLIENLMEGHFVFGVITDRTEAEAEPPTPSE